MNQKATFFALPRELRQQIVSEAFDDFATLGGSQNSLSPRKLRLVQRESRSVASIHMHRFPEFTVQEIAAVRFYPYICAFLDGLCTAVGRNYYDVMGGDLGHVIKKLVEKQHWPLWVEEELVGYWYEVKEERK